MLILEPCVILPPKYTCLGMRSLDTLVCGIWLTFSIFLRITWYRRVYVQFWVVLVLVL